MDTYAAALMHRPANDANAPGHAWSRRTLQQMPMAILYPVPPSRTGRGSLSLC